MRTIVIDQKGCHMTYDRQILMIQHDSFKKPISVPFGQIQSLIIVSAVDISTNLLTKLAEHRIQVQILPASRTGSACVLHGSWHAGVTRRKIQYELLREDSCVSQWATVLVKLKLHTHCQFLSYLVQHCQGYPNLDNQVNLVSIAKPLTQLRLSRRRLKTYFLRHDTPERPQTLIAPQYDIASLRGIEGSAAAIFFGAYQRFFDPKWEFTHRNRRPPKDPVNTLLSLGYTLLQGLCEQAVFTIGFDPFWGVLHEVAYGRQSLACDFAEINRWEIERWVWQLCADKVVTLADFNMNAQADRPCELLKVGRSRVYQSWSQLRPVLQKKVQKQVWLWYRRIEKQFDLTGEDAMVNAVDNTVLDFVSDWD